MPNTAVYQMNLCVRMEKLSFCGIVRFALFNVYSILVTCFNASMYTKVLMHTLSRVPTRTCTDTCTRYAQYRVSPSSLQCHTHKLYADPTSLVSKRVPAPLNYTQSVIARTQGSLMRDMGPIWVLSGTRKITCEGYYFSTWVTF